MNVAHFDRPPPHKARPSIMDAAEGWDITPPSHAISSTDLSNVHSKDMLFALLGTIVRSQDMVLLPGQTQTVETATMR